VKVGDLVKLSSEEKEKLIEESCTAEEVRVWKIGVILDIKHDIGQKKTYYKVYWSPCGELIEEETGNSIVPMRKNESW
jgi:hypothetical protein